MFYIRPKKLCSFLILVFAMFALLTGKCRISVESDKILKYNITVCVKVRFSVKALKRPKQVGDFFFEFCGCLQKKWIFQFLSWKLVGWRIVFYPTRIYNFSAKKPKNALKRLFLLYFSVISFQWPLDARWLKIMETQKNYTRNTKRYWIS